MYFGEDEEQSCNKMCYICSSTHNAQSVDITTEASHTLMVLQGLIVKVEKVSFSLLAKVLKGSNDKEICEKQLNALIPLYACCKKYSLSKLENILVTLQLQDILCYKCTALFFSCVLYFACLKVRSNYLIFKGYFT